MSTLSADRRAFLKASAILVPAAYLLSFPVSLDADGGAGALTMHYLRITPEDEVVITSPVAELGQGTSTALAMVLGDALDARWNSIRIEFAPVSPEFTSPILHQQMTGASTGTSGFHDPYQKAGATARTMLMEAAARRWRVPLSDVRTQDGQVLGPAANQALTYGALAREASRIPAPTVLAPPPARAPRFTARRMPRFDIPAKVDGSALYAVDIAFPGMLQVAVAAAPVFGGRLVAYDRSKALAMKGVRGIVDLPNGVAVVADRWWTARRSLDELSLQWTGGAHAGATDATISSQLISDLESRPGALVKSRGAGAAALRSAERVVSRRYEVPFLAHATMEPMSCVAKVENGHCEVWAGTQHPEKARSTVAAMLGLDVTAVTINQVLAGGGFGRRQETDSIEQAVLVASRFPGVPVKVIWTREEDISHDFYRPAGISDLKAGVRGKEVETYSHKQVSPAVLPRMYPVVMGEYDRVVSDAIYSPYEFPNQEARWVRSDTHVPVGMWRSVGASQTVFAIESFIDEVAIETGADPYAMRRHLLRNSKRALAVLDRLVAISGWDAPPAGSAVGLAISHKNDDCLAAQSAQVTIREGRLVVERICTVADPGRAINPDAVKAQLEGAAIWALSAALYGKITIAAGAVQESNFHDYRVVRLAETPDFRTEILESGGALEGTGEGGAPGVAPAVCNALFRLNGQRIRKLPIMDQFLKV